MEHFGRTVALTAIMGLSLVVLASNVMLRQRLDPLARLQEGTRRLAAGDFGARVDVATGDEFQDLAASFNSMATGLRQSIERLSVMSWSTLEALARTIDANSPWTSGHSERVTRLSIAIGRRMGLGHDEIDRLHRGGLLHDVGKIGISPAILDKPSALTPEEMAVVKEHPTVGARILEPIAAFADVIGIVRHHHERFDGRGYPDGLRGEEIPLLARVTAVADVYDALVSDRPYRRRWDVEPALRYIADMAGAQFDPAVVRAFLVLVDSAEWAEASSGLRTPPRQLLIASA
jgi:putative nucleotidyltransferase with HDIG domain